MPTNDERREVAARLREIDHENNVFLNCAMYQALFNRDCRKGLCRDCRKSTADRLADLIEPEPINGETSDGYHTFNELYHHRALLFSAVVRNYPELCWKSKKHHAGDMYEGMFIVGINTPDGQASYHYDIEPYWDMFECEELEFAPEWDEHTPDQAIERIGKLTRHEPEPERTCRYKHIEGTWFKCECGEWYDGVIEPNYCPRCGAKVVEE